MKILNPEFHFLYATHTGYSAMHVPSSKQVLALKSDDLFYIIDPYLDQIIPQYKIHNMAEINQLEKECA